MEIEDHTERGKHLVAHKKTVPLYIGLTTGFWLSDPFLDVYP